MQVDFLHTVKVYIYIYIHSHKIQTPKSDGVKKVRKKKTTYLETQFIQKEYIPQKIANISPK